jgi:radical SAM superfamily enzyme YgiQ (UPF0313 family)
MVFPLHGVRRGPPGVLGRPSLALFNANHFNYGIANLGAQAVARYLLAHDVNVYFAFADMMSEHTFLNDEQMSAADCDVVGISIPFEDTYLNVLRMLSFAGFPIYSKDRGDEFPLVVGGGLAMINPMPFSDFLDAIVIGEGREAMYQIITRYRQARDCGISKRDALFELVDIPGVYIPSHYRIQVDDRGYVTDFECMNGHPYVEANRPLDLSQHPMYSVWTSRYASYEQDDYFSVMAAMGCHKKCPFCVVDHVQGASSGRAMTIDLRQILNLALERRERYGTNLIKIFFSSAFSPDEGDINSMAIKELLEEMSHHGFSCRVGSLNVRQADEELFRLLHSVGQREVTFAPETTEELRSRLGKAYISDEKLHELASYAKKYGFSMNIYSLGALPGETDEHTKGFATLIRSLRKTLGDGNQMFVHYNPAFMKAQTPYQYFGNTRPAEIRRKFNLLKSQLSGCDVEFVSVIGDSMCYYQPVLALGDFEAGRVMAHLYGRPSVTEDNWGSAFHELDQDDSRYFAAKDPNKVLPWEHIAYSDHQRLKRRATAIGKPNIRLGVVDSTH